MTSFSLLSGELLRSQVQDKTILPQHIKGQLGIYYFEQFLGNTLANYDRVVSGSVPGGGVGFGVVAIGTSINNAVYSLTSRAFFQFGLTGNIKRVPWSCGITFDAAHGVAQQSRRRIGLQDSAIVGSGPDDLADPTDGIYIDLSGNNFTTVNFVCINGGVKTSTPVTTNLTTARHTALFVVDEFSPGSLRAKVFISTNTASRSFTEFSIFSNIPADKKLKIALGGIKVTGATQQGMKLEQVILGGVRRN